VSRPGGARRLRVFAAIAALSFVLHGGNHVRRGEAHDLLWMCNVAPAILAVGCAMASPGLVAVAALWLAFGTPMWLLDVVTGSGLILTTFLPHVVCTTVALLAARHLGMPRRSWLYATSAMLVLAAVTRIATPPPANVNLVFAVWKGWERYFPRYELYFALVVSGAAATFFVVERALARWVASGARDAGAGAVRAEAR
jgi:hypothetical protein